MCVLKEVCVCVGVWLAEVVCGFDVYLKMNKIIMNPSVSHKQKR